MTVCFTGGKKLVSLCYLLVQKVLGWATFHNFHP